MNDWVCPRFKWDDGYRPNRGRVLERRRAGEARPLPSLFERERRPRRGAHAARRAFEGGVLHARLRPQQVRRLHGDPGRISGGHGPPAAQAQGGRARPCPSPPSACRPTRRSASSPSAAAIRRCARRSPTLAERGIVADYMRIRALPVRRDGGEVPGRARSHLRRRAEPRRAAQVAADAGDGRRRRTSCVRSSSTADSRCRAGTWSTASPASWSGASHADAETRRSPTRTCCPNKVGLTLRDYEGAPSTLCAGCGHDSVTAAIVRSFYELDTPPHMIAKLSGIGCSSKTPTYFVSGAHGFNSAHGRMPRSRPAPRPPTAT